MNLEFKIYELKEDSRMYNRLIESMKLHNEFIIVGEEMIGNLDCYKVQPVDENGIQFIADMIIDEFAMSIQKQDLRLKPCDIGCDIYEFDIPKKYLTLDAIDNIKRLND